MSTNLLYINSSNGARSFRLNNSTAATISTAAAPTVTHLTGVRATSTTQRGYADGATTGDQASASAAGAIGTEIASGRRNSSVYATNVPRMIYYGPAWTDADVARMDTCVRAYLISIGAMQ